MKTLLLIDANSFIHRAYHALPPLKNKKGEPTGALYGLTNTLIKLIDAKHPDYVAAAFDRPEPTFRKDEYEEYKAHRPEAPDELISQIIEARNLFKNLGIPIFEVPKYEADDIIGTLTQTHKNEKDIEILILTGDLDLLQLVEKNVFVEIPRKGISDIVLYKKGGVIERFGVSPEHVPDYKGLTGDSSDNIPGVPGIGPKSAQILLQEFKTVEGVYKNITEDHKLAKKILPHKKDALLSKRLATIKKDAPLKASLKDITYVEPKKETLTSYLLELGFESIVKRLGGKVPTRKQESRKAGKQTAKDSDSVIFITDETKLDAATRKSKKIKVARDWKGILKSSKDTTISQPLFDTEIAEWLLNQDAKPKQTSLLAPPETIRDEFVTLERKLKNEKLEHVFFDIEMPLIPVLAEVELNGINIKKKELQDLKKEAERELQGIEKKIYKAAGEEFNVRSPGQVAEILFEKLNIKGKGRRTAGGKISTKEEVLQELESAHPVIPLILEYRETFKIKSTYLEPLIDLERDGKIRTTYLQTGTATGRLSSEKPNLQNIPQGSKWAKPLRNAFVAAPKHSLVACDYSQLELRLLAHTTRDKELVRAFEEGKDIHTLTASKIFDKRLDEVTKEERRVGKTLNFGIIYGMGPRAFAKGSGRTLTEAKDFIDTYFASFPKIQEWHQEVIADTHERGYVENENGRKRFFKHAGTSHPRVQAEIERMAMNMPLQSLGADILKLSMIETAHDKDIKLLLSIHDELIFEVPDDILEKKTRELKKTMESVYKLRVPLVVDVKTGKTWGSLE